MEKSKKINSNKLLNTILLGNKSYIILVLLTIALSFISPLFLTQSNILNVLRQVCVTTIACVGFTLILGSGHMDLSVGMNLCLVGIVMGKLLISGVPIWITIILGILLGAACGMVNGALITIFSLPPFIATLATNSVFKGVGYVITKNVPISNLPAEFVNIGQGYLWHIPIPIYIMVASIIIMWFIINRTTFGRHAIAMGGNAEAARVSGVRIDIVRIKAFALLGAFTALASVVQTARSASAQLTAGQDLSMDAIAAVVIGGTSMKGGNANILGSFAGCLIVGIVNNGLNLLRVDANWQIVAKGLLILFAVVLDVVTTRIYERLSTKA